MTSSDVFRSSPTQGLRRAHLEIRSSSPDLPPLQDILSQGPSRPPLRSGSKATPIPVDAPTAFISARNLLTTETAPEGHQVSHPDHPVPEPPREPDHDESVVEILPENLAGARKLQARKGKEKETSGVKKTKSKPRSSEAEKVRKQPRARAKKGKNEDAKKSVKAKAKSKTPEPNSHEGTDSVDGVFNLTHPNPVLKLKAPVVEEEGLNLEPATTRKVDWTPPAQKTVISLDSDTSAFKQLSSPGSAQQATVFRNLVQGYSCADETLETVSAPSDEDSSFLKKRKRIELVAMNDPSLPEPEVPDKSPVKKKAPKKKARTITELATAAYRKTTQPDDTPSASLLDHFPVKDTGSAANPTEPSKKGKGKSSSRKKPTKSSKKKAPPKPVLLSPGAALDQVARQDFVFGTSSQLAREPSPTVLRDIQAALRLSNRQDSADFTIPVNSDDVEPSEQRPRLWDAAARDADGDLFDVEVIDLAGKSPQIHATSKDIDPFGYVRGEEQDELPAIPINNIVSEDADSFVNLSDILPSPDSKPVPINETECFSESGLSTSTNILDQGLIPAEQLSHQDETTSTQPKDLQPETGSANLPVQPNYDLFTDAQLAKEIKTYGFKPIKRRNAMIALLDQCWQSKTRLGHAGIHTSTSRGAPSSTSKQSRGSVLAARPDKTPLSRSKQSKAATEPLDPTSPVVPEKRPRGRPRKDSISATEPQEPPPSAQPPETPKRPRGRPRKDSLGSSPLTPSRSRTYSISPKKPASTHGPTRRKKANKAPIIEIPDSASDGDDFASSPDSAVEQMFSSPPPLDMSLTATDETELSLAASPDDQQTVLFGHITEAIKSAPRTTDPANPSWHEKILLYDPIILEDLTTWLNSGQLSRVGFDAEISPSEVKKWCESKSVCSVWRVNLRGKERKRL